MILRQLHTDTVVHFLPKIGSRIMAVSHVGPRHKAVSRPIIFFEIK
jgi:hypothetical protein